ncbi:MAG TPA: hypothetical protein VFR18_27820 [Terriglobia bacterium]|nr:hypothetical protein [Terriglobia bacterium]
MPVTITTRELSNTTREAVASKIRRSLSDTKGNWVVSIRSDPRNNAWDVEVNGPRKSHWERRFSGDDRDAEVIAEAIRSEIESSGQLRGAKALNDALSALAIQGIAFLGKPDASGETTYIVDRVELKENEILYLHTQGALTRRGIQRYLLERTAA